MYVTNIQAATNTAGTTTTLVLPSLNAPGNQLLATNQITLSITNPSGSGQSITSGLLVFTGLVGGVTSTITYSLGTVNIPVGTNATFLVPIANGILANPSLLLVFASNPTAATVFITADFEEGPIFNGGMYATASGAINTSGTTTTLTLPQLLQPGNQLNAINSVLVSITNPASSGQTINAGSLTFSDTVGGVASSVSYALSSVSIAAGANATFFVPLSNGILNVVSVAVTFAGTPSSGTLAVLMNYSDATITASAPPAPALFLVGGTGYVVASAAAVAGEVSRNYRRSTDGVTFVQVATGLAAGSGYTENGQNGDNGTLIGSPTWTADAPAALGYGVCLAFAGGTQQVNAVTILSPSSTTYTLAVWAKWAAAPSSIKAILIIGSANEDGINLLSTGKIAYYTNNTQTIQTGSAPALNTWHLLAVECNGASQTLYIDGTPSGTSTITPGFPGGMVVGIGGVNGTAGLNFTGEISNPQIYPSALSSTDITNLVAGSQTSLAVSSCNWWKLIDNSGSTAVDSQAIGASRLWYFEAQAVVASGPPSPWSPAVSASPFHGIAGIASNWLSMGNVLLYDTPQAWSAMAGFVCTSKPASASLIFTTVKNVSPSAGTQYPGYELWIDPNGKLKVLLIHNITLTWIEVTGSTDVSDGLSHIVLATYDGSGTAAGVVVYLDGVAQSLTIVSNTLGITSCVGSGPFTIANQLADDMGNNYALTYYMRGRVKWFNLSTIARSSAYATTYAATEPPEDANHSLYLAMTEGAGTSTQDTSSNSYVGTLTSATMWN